MRNHTHSGIAIVALVLIFGTVVPLGVLAENTATISNSVSASSHTGGQDGADGIDGADGADGRRIRTRRGERHDRKQQRVRAC